MIPGAHLQGQHRLQVFLFDIYDASLWTEKKGWNFSQKFALSLHYLRAVDKEDIIDTSLEEMARYANIEQDASLYRATLERIFVNVSEGDRITALFQPQQGLTFYLNGTVMGEIKDLTLVRHFIAIWLHPQARYQEMRQDLLGM